VSTWEIAIKLRSGRLSLTIAPEDSVPMLLQNGFRALPMQFRHTFAVRHLPPHHSDPFDRMLIAQAQCEGLTLVTADPVLHRYGIPILDAAR